MNLSVTQRAEWRRLGLCTNCGRKRDGKTLWCSRCRAVRNVTQKARRQGALANGICPRCVQALVEGRGRLCKGCRDYHAQRKRPSRRLMYLRVDDGQLIRNALERQVKKLSAAKKRLALDILARLGRYQPSTSVEES